VLRRLAREAVIFMLLGMLLTVIGTFGYLHHNENQRMSQWKIVSETPARPGSWADKYRAPNKPGSWAEGLTAPTTKPAFDPNAPYQRVEQNSEPLFDMSKSRPIQRDNPPKINNLELALTSFWAGLCGFVGGLGVWLFYRLVRFAVKG
jgi:hypothetical protein